MSALARSHRHTGGRSGRRRAGIAMVALVAVLAASVALVGCGQGRVDVGAANEAARLEAENAKLKKDLDAANVKVGELEQRVDLDESGVATATGSGAIKPTNDAGGAGESGKQIGFIKKVYKKGSRYYLTIDYVQFLTGQAAIKAAIADGVIKAGEPLDNDYYIRNQNPKLRTFIILVGAPVTAETYFSGGNPVGKASLSLAEFASAMSPPDADNGSMKAAPWWITLKNSTVTKIAEQYIP